MYCLARRALYPRRPRRGASDRLRAAGGTTFRWIHSLLNFQMRFLCVMNPIANQYNCRCGNKIGEFFAKKDHKGFVNFVFSSEIFVFCGASRGTLKPLNFGPLHAPTRSVCSVTAFGRSVCSVVDSVPPLLPRWHGYRLRRTLMARIPSAADTDDDRDGNCTAEGRCERTRRSASLPAHALFRPWETL